jgi:hypothetical protein
LYVKEPWGGGHHLPAALRKVMGVTWRLLVVWLLEGCGYPYSWSCFSSNHRDGDSSFPWIVESAVSHAYS